MKLGVGGGGWGVEEMREPPQCVGGEMRKRFSGMGWVLPRVMGGGGKLYGGWARWGPYC